MSLKHSNRLIQETSPYLLQHAHNPVDWYPWGEEALKKAKEEDKPLLVSIGYSACHWCHVMERESFENEETALLMNEHFINVKIDREERPDLDHIYMDAVQAMAGSGGWPLNVFLTPEAKPFYGGTYFPPTRAFNRASWKEVLEGVRLAFKEKRNEIEAQAENLTDHLQQSNSFGIATGNDKDFPVAASAETMTQHILKTADKLWGGFGNAPKFPQTFTIKFLLRNSLAQTPLARQGLDQALLSLDKMIEGGIYDQLGGGFARYSTDTEWLVPHFEKMLYDNALLIDVLTEAFQLTGKESYGRIIDETMVFIERELLHDEAGFYSALDADSEGVEGKFYVWERKEIKNLLADDADIFAAWFDISENGNLPAEQPGWVNKNILRTKKSSTEFIAEKNIAIEKLNKIISSGKKILLANREKRIRPQLDDKIILGWNALMNTACSKAFAASGNAGYKELALRNMHFLLEAFVAADGKSFHHTWKNKQAKYPAFLDDYAFLIRALIHLQEITADRKWLEKAAELCQHVIDHFIEKESGFFFYTSKDQDDVIVRKKEVYDGAIPSGNSIMAINLYRLSILLDKPEWKQQAMKMLEGLEQAVIKYPGSFGNWASFLLELVRGTNEIAIVGTNYPLLLENTLKEFIPHKVLMAAENPVPEYPLLEGKQSYEQAAVFLCRNYSCQQPVFSAKDLMSLINSPENR